MEAVLESKQSKPGLQIGVPPELVDIVEVVNYAVERAVARVAEQQPDRPEAYIDVAAAAEFLACKPHRIYDLVERCAIPVHREGRRPLFRASELSAYVEDSDGAP